MSNTIVFIHGDWMSPASWDLFKDHYENRGYRCLAPAWPYDNRPVPDLQRSPDPKLASVGIEEIVTHYANIIKALPERAVLIGHSFGGLIVQILLDRGMGAAGIAIDPAPVRGVRIGSQALRASMPALLTWRGWKKVIKMPFKNFQRTFVENLPEDAQRRAYERHVVPTPGRIYFQNGVGIASRVNFKNPKRAPLLLIAGLNDRTVEPRTVRAAYRKYLKSPAYTKLKEFPYRTHFLIASPGWEQIADYCIEWAERRVKIRLNADPSYRAGADRRPIALSARSAG
jgi:pimeloyl-ACP methyl ester carboxylesterase